MILYSEGPDTWRVTCNSAAVSSAAALDSSQSSSSKGPTNPTVLTSPHVIFIPNSAHRRSTSLASPAARSRRS